MGFIISTGQFFKEETGIFRVVMTTHCLSYDCKGWRLQSPLISPLNHKGLVFRFPRAAFCLMQFPVILDR